MRFVIAVAMAVLFGMSAVPASAGDSFSQGARTSPHPKSDYYRGAPQVRGYSRSVGGYSYGYADGLIDSRDQSVFLDPNISAPADDRGPFDSGYFFDSGIGTSIDNSPYLN